MPTSPANTSTGCRCCGPCASWVIRSRRSAARAIRRAIRTSRTRRWPGRCATRRRSWRTSRRNWISTPRRSSAGCGARRTEGFEPGVVVGVPGVADPQKLLSIAARIGVKDAKRFLVKNLRFVTGLARSGGFYKPTGFVEAIAPLLADPTAGVVGFHLYTFNAVEATETWRQSMLEGLGTGVPPA